jgi:hypothetical protein
MAAATAPPSAPTETYHLELKPGPDPLQRQGISREPIKRLRRLLRIAGRECGFRVRWGQSTPPVELSERDEFGGPMIRFTDGPAANQRLMLRRAPLYLRVTFDTIKKKWNAIDQLADTPAAGEAVFAYRRQGEPSVAMIDWTEKGRRRGGCFSVATYAVVAEQPDDATMRDTKLWREWCYAQQKRDQAAATPTQCPHA